MGTAWSTNVGARKHFPDCLSMLNNSCCLHPLQSKTTKAASVGVASISSDAIERKGSPAKNAHHAFFRFSFSLNHLHWPNRTNPRANHLSTPLHCPPLRLSGTALSDSTRQAILSAGARPSQAYYVHNAKSE